MTKVIKKSQLKGLAKESSTARADTASLVEAACAALPKDQRPSSVGVWVQGAGAFGLSAVSSAKRHLGIVKHHQAAWDLANGVPPAEPLTDGPTEGSSSEASRPAEDITLRRAEAAEAQAVTLRERLDAALELIERQDARHRQDEKEKGQLRLDLERARAAPRARLPKNYDGLDGKPTSH